MSAKQTYGKIPYSPYEQQGDPYELSGSAKALLLLFALLLWCATKNPANNCASDQITVRVYILCFGKAKNHYRKWLPDAEGNARKSVHGWGSQSLENTGKH